jgi:hypothetical protein
MNITSMNTQKSEIDTHVKVGCRGKRETQPHKRITFINGINYNYEQTRHIAGIMSIYHQYNKVHFVCDETQGFIPDVIDAMGLLVAKKESEAVDKLADLWMKLFEEMDEPNHPECRIMAYAWSRGGLVTDLALQKLPAHLRIKMIVYTFGTPAIISSNKARKIEQISNDKDYVPYANPSRWKNALGFSCQNDKNIPSKSKSDQLDHHVIGGTYLAEIQKIGETYSAK